MSHEAEPDARLDALEIHVAHQAQVIEDLNAAVAAQWTVIDGLRRRLGEVADRLDAAEAQVGPPSTQRPPHY